MARGLDFPAVDWVIQLDCPEDADTYIHRVGRTARYERNGRAVLFLDPSEEEGMLRRLEQKKVPIEKINVRQNKQQSIKSQLQNMCFKDPELKYLGQKAFVSYVRSIHIQKDKEVFKVKELPLDEFSASLGLPGAPRIKFLKGDNAKQLKNAPRHGLSSSEEESEGVETGQGQIKEKKKDTVRTKYDRMFERRNQDVLANHYAKLVDGEDDVDGLGDADEDDDFLTVKRRLKVGEYEGDDFVSSSQKKPKEFAKIVPVNGTELVIDSKRREKLLKSKKKLLKLKGRGTKLVYDDDGIPHEVYELEDEDQFRQRGSAADQKARFLDDERQRLQTADLADKQAAKEKKKSKREKRKAREAAERDDDDGAGGVQAVLVPYEGEVDGAPLESEASDDAGAVDERPIKRPKKWFEDDSDGEAKSRRQKGAALEEPHTLEDLEALASGLLH